MKQKSVKIATLKDWLISKIYNYYDDPSFSLRYQKYYFKFVLKAPVDFNAFCKYYHQKLKDMTIDTRLCSAIASRDLLTIDQFKFGDIKKKKGNIYIIIWANKAILAKNHFSGHTGMPPRITTSETPWAYSGVAVYHA